ncbi:MAG: ABC transporter permease subunit [Patescibacteria group bacterium]|nr:ABC transporter permease subunit [Patescibacteria group bacterium]
MRFPKLQDSISNIIPLCKREFTSYFNGPIAYIFVAVFFAAANWLFFQSFFVTDQAVVRPWFELLPWVLLLLAPAITMRSWAEEKRSNTIEFLLTLPVRDFEVVLAKFVSSFAFLGLVLGLSISVPLTVGWLGDMDAGAAAAGYAGALLLGGLYLSIGLLVSAFTKNQIIAFLISASAMFVLIIIGSGQVLAYVSGTTAEALRFLSATTHFNALSRGIVDTRDIVYFLSFTAFFIYLNVHAIASRNWR